MNIKKKLLTDALYDHQMAMERIKEFWYGHRSLRLTQLFQSFLEQSTWNSVTKNIVNQSVSQCYLINWSFETELCSQNREKRENLIKRAIFFFYFFTKFRFFNVKISNIFSL